MEDSELDDILNSALDDFEEDFENPNLLNSNNSNNGQNTSIPSSNNNNNNLNNSNAPFSNGGGLDDLDVEGKEFIKLIEQLAQESDKSSDGSEESEETIISKLAEGMSKLFSKNAEFAQNNNNNSNPSPTNNSTPNKNQQSTPTNPSSSTSTDSNKSSTGFDASELQMNIEKTLKMLAENANNLGNVQGKTTNNPNPDDPMSNILGQFQDLEQNQEFQGVMENMMHKLMSKDVLYEPMQEIRSKYPEWLQENEKKLSPEEFLKYKKQFDFVTQICQTYETDPENFPKIIELMQAMQECGQPPENIVSQLSSSLNGPDAQNCTIQ